MPFPTGHKLTVKSKPQAEIYSEKALNDTAPPCSMRDMLGCAMPLRAAISIWLRPERSCAFFIARCKIFFPVPREVFNSYLMFMAYEYIIFDIPSQGGALEVNPVDVGGAKA